MAAHDSDALFAAHLDVATKLGHSFPIPCFSPEETEQEARLALWQAACKFDSTKGAFEAFATIVIRNHLRNTFNKAKRDSSRTETLNAPLVADDDAPGILAASMIDPAASPSLVAERADISNVLYSELRTLTAQQQDVLKQHAEGESFSDIARAKGVSKAAVRQMSLRAVEQMRPNLEAKEVGVRFLPSQDSTEFKPLRPPFQNHQRYPAARHQHPVFNGLVTLLALAVVVLLGAALNWFLRR
jgi:RNA polymerase sigma factor (sigma-70 family)